MALTQSSEEGLKISNAGTNGQFLQKQSGNTGGLTWATVSTGTNVGGANGVDFNDDVLARFGTGNDLEIYHNGSTSFITDGIGDFRIRSNGLKLQAAGGDNYVHCTSGGAVLIHYDDDKKLETHTNGVAVSGRLNISAQPAFRASLTSNYSSVGTIIFNSEQFEQGGNNYDATTGVYTCPVAGLYMFVACITCNNASGDYQVEMYKNSDVIGRAREGGDSSHYSFMNLTVIQQFSANDTCHVKNNASSTIMGSTGSESQHTQFMGYFLG